METIKFSIKSTFFKIWHALSFFTDEENYPKDTCTLKRRSIYYVIWSLITLPLFLIWQCIYYLFPSLKDSGFTGTIVHTINIFCQLMGIAVFESNHIGNLFTGYLIGGIAALLIITSISLVSFLFVFLYDKYIQYKRRKTNELSLKGIIQEPNMFVTLYKGWKEKLCSKIEYVDDVEGS